MLSERALSSFIANKPRYAYLSIFGSIIGSIFSIYIWTKWHNNLFRKNTKSICNDSKEKDKDKEKELPLSVEQTYYNSQISRFLKTYEISGNATKYNANIDSSLYFREQYENILKNENNSIELQWKSRILFESTPRGNVVMHYDAFKQGFVYYADQHIPYIVLNAVAMKYVILFRCRDFFMDEHVIPDNFPSMILHKQYEEDKKEKTNKIEKMNKMSESDIHFIKKTSTNSGPFVKLKNYNSSIGKSTVLKDNNKNDFNNAKKIVSQTIAQKQQNRFIFLGKITNFRFLNTPPKNKAKLFPSDTFLFSALSKQLMDQSDTQVQVFNYRDFKNLKTDVIINS